MEMFSDPVKEWEELFRQNSLRLNNFWKYWEDFLVQCFRHDHEFENYFNEHCEAYFFDPLEKFMFSRTFASIFEENGKRGSSFCRKCLLSHDIKYSCADCATGSCNLCSECFENSSHKEHRYRILKSSPYTTFCDCGCEDSLIKNKSCSLHGGAENLNQFINGDIDNLIERTTLVFDTIIYYARILLTLTEEESHVKDFKDDHPSFLSTLDTGIFDTYALLVFFPGEIIRQKVSKALVEVSRNAEMKTAGFNSIIGEKTYCIFLLSTFDQCVRVKRMLTRAVHTFWTDPNIQIISELINELQDIALALLSWLKEILTEGDLFRQIFLELLMKNNGSHFRSIFDKDMQMREVVRNTWASMIVIALNCTDHGCKLSFAQLFSECFFEAVEDIDGDIPGSSLLYLCHSVYTSPWICFQLVENHNFLQRFVNILFRFVPQDFEDGFVKELGFSGSTQSKIRFVFLSCKRLLRTKPVVWKQPLRNALGRGAGELINLMSLVQNMHQMKLKSGDIEDVDEGEKQFDGGPEFSYLFEMTLELFDMVTFFTDYSMIDRTSFVLIYKMVLKALGNVLRSDGSLAHKYITDFMGYSAECIIDDRPNPTISMHSPVSRLLAQLTPSLHSHQLRFDSPELVPENQISVVEMMDSPLRLQAFFAKFSAGQWIDEHYSLSAQLMFYNHISFRRCFLDDDIRLLQLAAAQLEPNAFLIHMIEKFGLKLWTGEDYEISEGVSEIDNINYIERFLLLVVILIGERYTPGIGEVTEEDCMKKEIILILCEGASTHSVLCDSLSSIYPEKEEMYIKIIDEVTEFKTTVTDPKGLYHLKEKYYKEFNSLSYHYSASSRGKAEEQRRKKSGDETFCPPPVPPLFTPAYAPILKILESSIFLHLIKMILIRSWDGKDCSYTSSALLQMVLHLLTYALYEEEREGSFCFTSKASQFLILDRLKCIGYLEGFKEHKNFILWIIRRFNSVANLSTESTSVLQISDREEKRTAKRDIESSGLKKLSTAERNAKVMAKMSAMQRKFVQHNISDFNEVSDDPSTEQEPTPKETCAEAEGDADKIAIGPLKSDVRLSFPMLTCILCKQEESLMSVFNKTKPRGVMLVTSSIQMSNVLSRKRYHDGTFPGAPQQAPEPHDYNVRVPSDTLVLPSDLSRGVHVSSCHHTMHIDCWNAHIADATQAEKKKYKSSLANFCYDPKAKECPCLICGGIGNAVLPFMPNTLVLVPPDEDTQDNELNFCTWMKCIKIAMNSKGKDEHRLPFAVVVRRKIAKEMTPTIAAKFIAYFALKKLPTFSPAFYDLISLFRNAIHKVCLGTSVYGIRDDPLNLKIIYISTAYTIRVAEEIQRISENAIFCSLSAKLEIRIAMLVKFAPYVTFDRFYKRLAETITLRLLSVLMDFPCDISPCLLEWDAFSVLVSLCLGMPSIFPRSRGIAHGSNQELMLLQLTFFSHIIQILLDVDEDSCLTTSSDSSLDAAEKTSHCYSEATFIRNLWTRARALLDLPSLLVDADKLLKHVKEQCLPFLRCCALFFHFLTDVPTPIELQSEVWVPESEYLCIVHYLGLDSNIQNIFNEPPFEDLTRSWLHHSRLKECLANKKRGGTLTCCIPLQPTRKSSLIPLPEHYRTLLNMEFRGFCNCSVKHKFNKPTLCLVCGTLLCSESYCCKMQLEQHPPVNVGACTYHSYVCGGGSGVFLDIHLCKIILLSGLIKGFELPSPYLDEWGSYADRWKSQWRPLKLNHTLYDVLQMIWLSHRIPDEIALQVKCGPRLYKRDWKSY